MFRLHVIPYRIWLEFKDTGRKLEESNSQDVLFGSPDYFAVVTFIFCVACLLMR